MAIPSVHSHVGRALCCAALVLSGCFVVSKNVPAGTGPINDDRASWAPGAASIQTASKHGDTAFLHFQKPDARQAAAPGLGRR